MADGITKVTISSGDHSVEFDSPEEFDAHVKGVIDALAVRPPALVEFGGRDYMESSPLRELGDHVIGKWPELHWLEGYTIRYLWKAKGGEKSGRPVLGKCSVPSGLTRHFALCDWIVWLAADRVKASYWTPEMTEALMYHELTHCILSGDEEEPTPAVRGHDLEVFLPEIDRYGLWAASLEEAARVFAQVPLPGMEP